MLTIKSLEGSSLVSLVLRPTDTEATYRAELRSADLSAGVDVCAYDPRGADLHFRAFFKGLAAHWSGWDGKREWSSLEGELSISAEHDGVGQVRFHVTLSAPFAFTWRVQCALHAEVGELDLIAKQAEELGRAVYSRA